MFARLAILSHYLRTKKIEELLFHIKVDDSGEQLVLLFEVLQRQLAPTMDLLSLQDCEKIVEKCLGCSDFEVVSYDIRSASEAAAGFIGASKLLFVTIQRDGVMSELHFFTKTLPENEFHRKNVEQTRVFYKEGEFFKSIVPEISKYFDYKLTPTCYHSDPNKLLVFEDLAVLGYKNADSTAYFDVEHCKAVLSRLANFHASSFLYEKEVNSTIDKMFPHLHCGKISWFKNEKGHPGYEHCQTGVRALGVVLDRYFGQVNEDVRVKVRKLLASNPALLLPSKKYRNALAHADLWCNNLMFKYDAHNRIEDCVLVDFQLFGYCPPATDVYSLIFIVSNKQFRAQHSAQLVQYYYEHFRKSMEHQGANPDEFLSWKEFQDSVSEALPVALTNAAIFLHYILLPEDTLDKVFGNTDTTKEFMSGDRSPTILKALDNNMIYNARVIAALRDCIDYVTGNLVY